MEQLIARFPIRSFEEVRVQFKELKGQDFLDIRVFASLGSGGDALPTGKGLLIGVPSFADLKKAVLQAEIFLKERARPRE